jgi:hypothetical protein
MTGPWTCPVKCVSTSSTQNSRWRGATRRCWSVLWLSLVSKGSRIRPSFTSRIVVWASMMALMLSPRSSYRLVSLVNASESSGPITFPYRDLNKDLFGFSIINQACLFSFPFLMLASKLLFGLSRNSRSSI